MTLTKIALGISAVGALSALSLAISGVFTEIPTDEIFAILLFVLIIPLHIGTVKILKDRKNEDTERKNYWTFYLFQNLPKKWIRNYKIAFFSIVGLGFTLWILQNNKIAKQLMDTYMFTGASLFYSTAAIAYWSQTTKNKFEQCASHNERKRSS